MDKDKITKALHRLSYLINIDKIDRIKALHQVASEYQLSKGEYNRLRKKYFNN
jgi:hypothetical protein